MTSFGEFGGDREDGVAYGAESWWGVFSSDSGEPIVLARTKDDALHEYAWRCSDEDDGNDGVASAEFDIDHGNVFVQPCAIAYAFDGGNDHAAPSLDWILGDAIATARAEATAAARAECAAEIAAARAEAATAALTERAACAAIAWKLARNASADPYGNGRCDAAAEIADTIESRSKG